MKKFLGILFISLLFFTSCDNDLLEPYTPGSLTEEDAVTSSNDLQRLLNSSMLIMSNRTEYVFSSVYTDEAAPGFNNGGQGITSDYVFIMNVANGSADAIWRVYYGALARINRVIVAADAITPKDAADAELIERSKAEALILRAMCHLKIMSYYSTNPSDDSALAGYLADRVILTTETPQRTTNGAFYELIHNDLDDALAIYSTNTAPAYLPAVAPIYPSRTLAQAIKARAYALKGDYINAETFADLVINTSGINLATSEADYNSVFHSMNQTANTEVIFKLRRTPQQNSQVGGATLQNNFPLFNANLHNGWASVGNRRNGSPFYEVSRALFNQFAPGFDPGVDFDDATITAATFAAASAVPDYRFRTNIAFSTSPSVSSLVDRNYTTAVGVRNTDILVLHKHGGQFANTSANTFNPDVMVSRISEMYLIKAEARAAAADFTGVASALQTIVNARFTTPVTVAVPANPQAAWRAILSERRKELSFEGFRFIDLKRLGGLAGVGLDRDPAEYASDSWNFPPGDPVNLPVTSFKFTLPIPVSELNANNGIQQNPGY